MARILLNQLSDSLLVSPLENERAFEDKERLNPAFE